MKCPHCNEECKIPVKAEHNVMGYDCAVIVATECCGKGVRFSAVRSYKLSAYEGNKTNDDWGVEFSGE
jgi:hypothetical protein